MMRQREEQVILQSGSPRARASERARENSPDKRMRLCRKHFEQGCLEISLPNEALATWQRMTSTPPRNKQQRNLKVLWRRAPKAVGNGMFFWENNQRTAKSNCTLIRTAPYHHQGSD
ncbi:Large ribosomal subunit protein [Trichinella spiralis]|uniref:Large ribosomal subunit protein n=1 Tax=Trichinella spiralis TaxID=6334 RepID=A0ABR3KMQ7_TRISP